jgi:DNA processing protein
MNTSISTNTQAILLLTAPLIAGRNGTATEELLTSAEYRRLARQLRELGRSPSDLLGTDSHQLLRELNGIVAADRVVRLLERGFMISQAMERWRSRAIWVTSRADTEYPTRIKGRLKDDSPAVLYGCGDPSLLEWGGLAVVGSRHVDEELIEYTEAIGRQCALARKTVISGAAQGIDRAAMRGGLESGGRVIGILADSLERAALNRENREWLINQQLVLISPYDPSAGFNVGNAMQRNKVIYALADAALVVSAEHEKGGTWAGATEQLRKLKLVPVYVRSTGEPGRGLEALAKLGAKLWPNPKDSQELLEVFNASSGDQEPEQPQLDFKTSTATLDDGSASPATETAGLAIPGNGDSGPQGALIPDPEKVPGDTGVESPMAHSEPPDMLGGEVRELLMEMLLSPKSAAEVAAILNVPKTRARSWLKKLVAEGALKKLSKPVRYKTEQQKLL